VQHKASEVLQAGLDQLRRVGWCKNTSRNNKGQMCGSGAMTHVTIGQFGSITPTGSFSYLYAAVEELYPGRGMHGRFALFNDHPATTFEDIEAVFELAIENAKKDEALVGV